MRDFIVFRDRNNRCTFRVDCGDHWAYFKAVHPLVDEEEVFKQAKYAKEIGDNPTGFMMPNNIEYTRKDK